MQIVCGVKLVVYATLSNLRRIINLQNQRMPQGSYFCNMYKLIRTILFWFDAEQVHYFSMRWLKRFSGIGFLKKWLAARYTPASHPIKAIGLTFQNAVGLAAGFDKNALNLDELAMLGFGHIEIGTVTPQPQAGNDKPRLFRLPEDKALINRMGFNNDGADVIAGRLKIFKAKNPNTKLIIGGNIGKNKDTPNEYAYMDYDKCFRALHPYVDYFVVNVSSPNTPGLRALQDKDALRQILVHLKEINAGLAMAKPMLLKIAPDLTPEQLDDVVDLALEIKLDGLVVANTTLDRTQLSDAGKIRAAEAGAGGLSGKPCKKRSTEMVKYVFSKSEGRLPIIASGGIFTAADAKDNIEAGASLVQVWTGFVYEGPAIVKRICAGLI